MTLRRSLARRRPSAGRCHARRARAPGDVAHVACGARRELRLRTGHRRRPCWSSAAGLPAAAGRLVGRSRPVPQRPGGPRLPASTSPPRSGARADPLTVAHAGAYFETGVAPRLVAAAHAPGQIDDVGGQADIVIAEPVWCDGHFALRQAICQRPVTPCSSTSRWRGRHTILRRHLGDDCPLVIAVQLRPEARPGRPGARQRRHRSRARRAMAPAEVGHGAASSIRGLIGSGPHARRAVGPLRAVVHGSRLRRSLHRSDLRQQPRAGRRRSARARLSSAPRCHPSLSAIRRQRRRSAH